MVITSHRCTPLRYTLSVATKGFSLSFKLQSKEGDIFPHPACNTAHPCSSYEKSFFQLRAGEKIYDDSSPVILLTLPKSVASRVKSV